MNKTLYDYVFKCVIIGDSDVGKTTLLRRYMGEGCPHSTNGSKQGSVKMDKALANGYVAKSLERSNVAVSLEIHDTMGQERYRSLTRSYYRGAHGCLVCFDVNNPASFDNLSIWLEDIKESVSLDAACILVGIIRPTRAEWRPCDSRASHTSQCSRTDSYTCVSRTRAEDFADKNNITYLEVNLSDNCHVESCFQKLAELMIDTRQKYGIGGPELYESINLSDFDFYNAKRTTSTACLC